MDLKATVPFWSIDAFLYFIMPRGYVSCWSSELMSRTSTFIDAYILFDKVAVPERYKSDKAINELDPDGEIFYFVDSMSLVHSDDLKKGISFDLSLSSIDFEKMEAENYKWYSQHWGKKLAKSEFDSIMGNSHITMAHCRLWQISLLNEIADLTG
ncbi:hypothetical protein CGI50_24620, partial [Vibrio parahaemolyticus]|uniref:hypothetical protein n=1 Tax=Vibrio parahaemolyticus TaxID=670 RepID=UPI00112420FD